MRFYDFAEIRSMADCIALARELYGCKINGAGRCAATWRGGDNTNTAHITKTEWFDHVRKEGGGPLELTAFKFNGDIQAAQQFLGDYLHLTPKNETRKAPDAESRYDRLIREGYTEIARYNYRDMSGTVRHFKVRLENPGKPGKEFVQGHTDAAGKFHWTLKGVATILYRLPEIAPSSWTIICEGEKSADRLAALGLPATTAPMGAGQWLPEYSEALRGKSVAIAPDNDEPGREHAELVARSLYGIAVVVKIITPDATLPPKAGVDDWLTSGHTADELMQRITKTPTWTPPAATIDSDKPTPTMLAEAKAHNAIPFRNYVPVEGEKQVRGKMVKDMTKEPRTHQAMLNDMWRRFLGFPRRVGTYTLFDHDRDTGEIITIDKVHEFRAWIARRSKVNPDFSKNDTMATELDLMASIRAQTRSYDAVSLVPDWPRRENVYYAHDPLPLPTGDHHYFHDFASFFLPSTHMDDILIKAMICCPLWYIPGVPRPAWIIDSREGQGSGKSMLATMIAELYGAPPLTVAKYDLERDPKEIRKRCVCAEGRNKRIFLMDNVVGLFKSPELSALMSFKTISGMAPYGHGEENRPNNFTFVITANNATVDSDLSDRCVHIFLRKPTNRKGWVERIQSYIATNRLSIIADIIDMLETHKPFRVKEQTRFSEFEQTILQPCAGSPKVILELGEHINETRQDGNIDDEQARSIIEAFNYHIDALGIAHRPVFIQTKIANSWGGQALSDTLHTERHGRNQELPVQIIRQLAALGKIPQIDLCIKRWPVSSAKDRYRGIAWNFSDSTEDAILVHQTPSGETETKTI